MGQQGRESILCGKLLAVLVLFVSTTAVGAEATVFYVSSMPRGWLYETFSWFFAVLVVLALARMSWLQSRALASAKGSLACDPRALSAYELAFLAGGEWRVLQTALFSLHLDGYVRMDAGSKRVFVQKSPPSEADEVELGIFRMAAQNPLIEIACIQEGVLLLRARLALLGLVPDDATRRRLWTIAAKAMLPVIVLGAVQALVDYWIEPRPNSVIVLTLLGSFAAFAMTHWRTDIGQRGRAMVTSVEATISGNWQPDSVLADRSLLLRGFALYGVGALTVLGLPEFASVARGLQQHREPPRDG